MKETIVNASQPSDLHTTSVGRTGWLFSWKNILKKTRARSSFLLLVDPTRLAPNLSEVRCPAFCVLRSSLVELTETHSNYKIIIDYVKNYKPSPDENQIDPEMTDLSYNPDSVIKTITQKQKTLSDTETRTIITKYQQGKSTYELAREFGCHRATISRALKDNGIEVTNQCAKKKVLAEMIMQMYSEWYKPQEIGKALGVSADTVRRILHENNVYIRKSWEYPKK